MRRLRENDGYITAVSLMLFMVLISVLVGTTVLAMNSFKVHRSYERRDESFYYSDYGINKAKDIIIDKVATADKDKRKEYIEDISLFVSEVNSELRDSFAEEAERNADFEGLQVMLTHIEDDSFEILSTGAVQDKQGGLKFTKSTKAPVNNIIASMGDKEVIPGEMPDLDAAIVTEDRVEFQGGVIKGKTVILDPGPKKVYVRNSFGGIQDSVVNGNVTPGMVYVYSKNGKYNYDNVHEVFEFQGMPYDTSAAEHLFHVERKPNGQGYLKAPRKDRIKIVDEDISLPRVAELKDYSIINNKAKPYELPELNSNKSFTMVDDEANLTFPTDMWKYSNNSEIVYPLRENGYYKSIKLKDSYVRYVFDVGDNDIEIVTDTLHLGGHVEVRGSGTLTIYVSDKNLGTTWTANEHFKLNPREVHAHTDGKQDNRKLVIVADTPDSMENTPLKLNLQSWVDSAYTVIAKHLDLRVIGKMDVNALSWGKNSRAAIESSSTFNSNLFYFKEGEIDYRTNYYYGSIIAKKVNMDNTSPTIEHNDIDSPTFDGFPLEISWETPAGKPSEGSSSIDLGESKPGRLEFGSTREVKGNE